MSESGLSNPSIPICQGPNPDPGKPKLLIPAGSCDCHAHIFGPADRYPFTSNRSYTPPEASIEAYRRMLGALGFDRAVIVQPSVYGMDNRCTGAAVRASNASWRGVAVMTADVKESVLVDLHSAGFRGVRLNLLFKGGMALDELERIAHVIEPFGWHVQLLLDGRELDQLADRFRRLPVDIVIDHIGHMPATVGVNHPGFQTLLQLTREGRCWVKLSGAYRVSGERFPYNDVVPFARALVETAPDRLVFGTDWPHPAVNGFIPQDASLLDLLPLWAPDEDVQYRILVTNPERLYDFPRAPENSSMAPKR